MIQQNAGIISYYVLVLEKPPISNLKTKHDLGSSQMPIFPDEG